MYHNFSELINEANKNGGNMAKVVLSSEISFTGASAKDIYAKIEGRWVVMQSAARKALSAPQEMVAGLISGQAQTQEKYTSHNSYLGQPLNHMMAMALSCSEVNASMGRICAAPTAGACGVLPAVMGMIIEKHSASHQQILDALLVASGVGAVITQNATVSGAEGGCQAECGAAAAMAAAAAVVMAGGTPNMVGNAISIVFMNCMGLACDPVAGLVQLPCSFRNASQAMNALLSADMALAGQNAVIPPDDALEAMYRVGRKLPAELRETAMGGIATSPAGLKIAKKLACKNG